MKILVHYAPGPKYDVYEGTRLRKNIKGALELNDITWVESIFALPEIAHFISPLDEAKAHDYREEGAKIVVSALYAEGDETCRYFEMDKDGSYVLTSKSERLLEEADLIFVPTEADKDLLTDCGFAHKRISVVTPGINLTRFERPSEIQKVVFRRYMRLKENEKYFLTLGGYDDKDTIEQLIYIAEKMPDMRFFFIGENQGGESVSTRLNKKTPRNITFSGLVEDDIYCAGMLGAEAFLLFSTMKTDELPCLEAMAAKTQIVHVGPLKNKRLLVDEVNCLAYDNEDDAVTALKMISQGLMTGTTLEARKIAMNHSLKNLGAVLKKEYESLLTEDEK